MLKFLKMKEKNDFKFEKKQFYKKLNGFFPYESEKYYLNASEELKNDEMFWFNLITKTKCNNLIKMIPDTLKKDKNFIESS